MKYAENLISSELLENTKKSDFIIAEGLVPTDKFLFLLGRQYARRGVVIYFSFFTPCRRRTYLAQ